MRPTFPHPIPPPLAPARAASPTRLLFGGLALYFALHLALRVAVSGSVELDEAEQLLWTQRLELGYGVQPPLYTWLQWAVFQAMGVSVAALALLKNLLLFGTYGFTFLAARRLMPLGLAALASATMLWLPQIGWESQRDLTHSVLLTTASAATLWLVLELHHARRAWVYAALGVAVAAGTLAKYSYPLLPLALAVAALAAPATRRVVLDARVLLTLAVATALVLPHALWVLDHAQAAVGSTAGKLDLDTPRGPLQVLRGLGSLLLATLAFLTPLWLLLAGLFGRSLVRDRHAWAAGRPPEAVALLWRYLGVVAVLLVGLVVVGGAGHFKDRWMQPYLFAAPLVFFASFPGLATHPRRRWLGRATVGLALVYLVMLTARAPLDGARGRGDELNLPVEDIALALRSQGVLPAAVLSNDKHLAGTMRLLLPHAQLAYAAPEAPLPALPGRVLLIAPEAKWAELAARGAWDGASVTTLTLPWRYGEDRPERVRLRFAIVEAPQR